MEEAEQRGERLKAMRLEAAQVEVFCSVDISTTKGCLSNPLIEPYSTPLTKENSLSVPRFDYYTDPMSAFSGNKRRRSSLQMPQDDVFPSISSGSPVVRVSSHLSGTILFVKISPFI
ncbi:PREDICTED: uncharacterized protein LOC104595505 [Nelumbo nucifera]|uniref:Uncharacterized protein LOC104595505 n=1 Tax=Nelumbo nucifera TaxID=4432 RepID=A0A1U8Q2H7_NELNU|nr:PREDICTED: uncharacterized protein LOC104595505 [Nelumbo nucifera]